MEPAMGVWIDGRKAVVVCAETDGAGQSREPLHVEAGDEKQLRLSAGKRGKSAYGRQVPPSDDMREASSKENLQKFFGKVLAAVREARALLIIGPGEAKEEFRKRLERDGLGTRVDSVQTAGGMSDRQIAAKTRAHFLPHARASR